MNQPVNGKRPKAFPNYDKSLAGAPATRAGQPDRSLADYTWCCTALRWGWTAEEVAAQLMQEQRSKAAERGEQYALRTARKAAAAVGGSAPITLVEYGDYQCPGCGELYLEIEKLREVLGDRLRFVFRQYPYAKLHPQAELAAEAAEAAGAQGRFWEMHNMLFRHQDALRKKHLLKYAEMFRRQLEQAAAFAVYLRAIG
jgi:protein-disulfide isomerase